MKGSKRPPERVARRNKETANTEPSPAVTLGDVSLTPTDLLRRLHQRGRLLPLLREAAVEQLLFVILKGEVRVNGSPDQRSPSTTLRRAGDGVGAGALGERHELPLAEAETETECVFLRRKAFSRSLSGANSDSQQTQASHLPAPRTVFPWVSQHEATDCGLAALAMIARFHGRNVSADSLRQAVRVEQRGASLLDLQRGATARGFRTRAVRVGRTQLASITLPAIAHLADEHYVVVYALERAGLIVGDPATGVVTLATESFSKIWTGTLLLLTQCEDCIAARP